MRHFLTSPDFQEAKDAALLFIRSKGRVEFSTLPVKQEWLREAVISDLVAAGELIVIWTANANPRKLVALPDGYSGPAYLAIAKDENLIDGIELTSPSEQRQAQRQADEERRAVRDEQASASKAAWEARERAKHLEIIGQIKSAWATIEAASKNASIHRSEGRPLDERAAMLEGERAALSHRKRQFFHSEFQRLTGRELPADLIDAVLPVVVS